MAACYYCGDENGGPYGNCFYCGKTLCFACVDACSDCERTVCAECLNSRGVCLDCAEHGGKHD